MVGIATMLVICDVDVNSDKYTIYTVGIAIKLDIHVGIS